MTSKQPKTPSFNYTPTYDLAPLSSIKTTWDLTGLYYKNANDPRIEADLKTTEAAYAKFAKTWRNKPFTTDSAVLARALADYEVLISSSESSKPGRYFWLRSCLDTNDMEAEKQLALMSRRLRKAGDQLIFFTLELGKVPKATRQAFLKAPELKPYRYYLERLFLNAAHHLTEAEEKIVNLKSRQSSGMWQNMTEKIISSRHITWKKKAIALPEALELIDTVPVPERPKLWDLIVTELIQIGEVAEHEFNAIISDVRTEDELRGFKKPYSATALGYEDSTESLENLVKVVSKKGFGLSQKFYRLKADYLGFETLHYSQRNISIGADVPIPFTDAVAICRDVFAGVNPEYARIFDTMLETGAIDVYPKSGKSGGAFMSATASQPTHVMLNQVDTFKSLETLAHEMGHAIHAERSKTQRPLYEGHSIITAETASTLFENLVFDAVYAQANTDERLILLHDRIGRDVSTIERQIAFFNAELEIHTTIEGKGAMSNDELRACMFKHLQSYLGGAVALEPKDGYSYVYIPHLRYGFYVYSYAYGILMSTIMADHFKADRGYAREIDTFLTSGESDTVAKIFKKIGIDTTAEDTFTKALKRHEQDITTFAKLTKGKHA
jgi:oligoendopeptidase F